MSQEFDSYDSYESYDEEYYNSFDNAPGPAQGARSGRQATRDASEEVRADAIAAWYEVAAAAVNQGCEAKRSLQIIEQLRGTEVLYRAIGDGAKVLRRTLSAVSAVLADLHTGEVWLSSLGLLSGERVAPDVREALLEISVTTPTEHPESRLAGAVAQARKQLSRDGAKRLIETIDAGQPPTVLAQVYDELTPPAGLDETASTGDNENVNALFSENASAKDALVISSGFRTLDLALSTRVEFPTGFIRSGQLAVIVAPSGSGKSSAINTFVPAMAQDALNQGHRGRTLFVHNEDETADIFASMGIAPGKRYAHLADSVAWFKTTSREEFVKFFYREVITAKRRSEATGLPVRLFMPPAVIVDYFQALTGAGENETVSTSATADLLLYGIGNCDPIAIRAFSGLGFSEYTGEAWPEGLSGYGISVLVTAQLLLKGTSSAKPYNPAKDDWRAYASADALDNPAWEPKPGDYPLAKLDDIRGSTKIIQHATTIIGLHRPRPRNNPEVGVNAAGFPTLADSRGYFTILKARFGQKMLVIPMEFNRQRNGGTKTQYIDAAAEAAMANDAVQMTWDTETYKGSGDPILPVRPRKSGMRLIRY